MAKDSSSEELRETDRDSPTPREPPVGEAVMSNSAPRPGALGFLWRICFHHKGNKHFRASFTLPSHLRVAATQRIERTDPVLLPPSGACSDLQGRRDPVPPTASTQGQGADQPGRQPPLLPFQPKAPPPPLPTAPSSYTPRCPWLPAPGMDRSDPDRPPPLAPRPSHPSLPIQGTRASFVASIRDHSTKT